MDAGTRENVDIAVSNLLAAAAAAVVLLAVEIVKSKDVYDYRG